MISIEMSREPSIRSYVRELYFQRACLTVRPTPRGYNEIDESHPCYPQKYLNMKPCTELKRDEYLRLNQAEIDGLLTIKFELRTPSIGTLTSRDVPIDEPRRQNGGGGGGGGGDDDWDDDGDGSAPKMSSSSSVAVSKSIGKTSGSGSMSIADKIKSFYLKDEFSYTVEKWNEQKAKIIDELLEKLLYPEFERELRSKLLAEAKEFVFEGNKSVFFCNFQGQGLV